jgi:uncharacterized protein
MMRNLGLVIVFFLMSVQTFAQTPDEFEKDILKYLEINGTKESMPFVIDQLFNQVKIMYPTVPDTYWTEFKAEMSKNGMEDLFKEMIPVYKKHFTHQEIKDIIDFYESPTGKKLSQKTPVLTQESMAVGQRWGMILGQKIMSKLEEKGYKKS